MQEQQNPSNINIDPNQEFTIVLKAEEIRIAILALDEIARRISNPIVEKIQSQLRCQVLKPVDEGLDKPLDAGSIQEQE